MTSHFKLPFSFDPAPLKADLARIHADEWVTHFNTREYEGDWGGVALRSPGGDARRLYPDVTGTVEYADTELLARLPAVAAVLKAFECPLRSVRLLRLAPGSRILEHRDYQIGPSEGLVRIHVPVRTNDRVEFYAAGRRLTLREGECWYVDFSQPHRVENRGAEERVHLVIDCAVNGWLRGLIPFESEDAEGAARRAEEGGRANAATRESFKHFRALVLGDLKLQEALGETTDMKLFVELVVRLGAERGYGFTERDVMEEARAGHRAWLTRWV